MLFKLDLVTIQELEMKALKFILTHDTVHMRYYVMGTNSRHLCWYILT